VPAVVFASTATVYGLTERLPVDEDAECRPITVYDQHKLRAEELLQRASNEGRVAAASLRMANVYGPSPGRSVASDRGVLNAMAARALRGDGLEIFGDGQYVRDYVYLDDVVGAFLSVGAYPELRGQSFNVGSGTGTTLRDACTLVAERAARVGGRRSLLRFAPWPADADPIDRRNFTANIDRLTAACGWRPRMALRDGIDALIERLAAARSDIS
jgi:UDP-glucose 4-epimerase